MRARADRIGWLPVLAVVVVTGVLHRHAAADGWADDRLLASEPSWFQMAAPRLHAAVPGSRSLPNGLVTLIDPLTRASTAGDIRALAACAAGLSAGAIVLLLVHLRVPRDLAAIAACSGIGVVLPVSTAASATLAIQTLLGALLLLAAFPLLDAPDAGNVSDTRDPPDTRSTPWWLGRLAALATLTIAGAATHVSFLAFAAAVWIVIGVSHPAHGRVRTLIVGVAALVTGLSMGARLVHLNAAEPVLTHASDAAPRRTGPDASSFALAGGRPGSVAIAAAIVTGRFTPGQQPSSHHDAGPPLTAAYWLPGPTILTLPLAALAFAWPRRDTRRLALTLAAAAAASWLFARGTWLPDPRIACAPARVATLLLAGLGLSWLAAQPMRGTRALSAIAAATIGLFGFADLARFGMPVQNARLQAFVESASAAFQGDAWVAERIAIDRARLLHTPLSAASRVPAQRDLLRVVPDDRAVIALPLATERLERDDVWSAARDLSYTTAASFLAAHREGQWLALAVSSDAGSADAFTRDLLARLDAPPASDGAIARLTALARLTADATATGMSRRDRLDVTYDRAVGATSTASAASATSATSATSHAKTPAHFILDTAPIARVTVNAQSIARTPRGAALVLFDPARLRTEDWILGLTPDTSRPAIRDMRLQASYLGAADRSQRRPGRRPQAITNARVDVAIDDDRWFGEGWHGHELAPTGPFRWSRAQDAHLRLMLSRRQALRVQLRGALFNAPNGPNTLAILWNGTVMQAPGAWTGEGVWTIPAALVHRGLNVFTIRLAYAIAPGSVTPGGDPRPLGAAITALSIEPAEGALR